MEDDQIKVSSPNFLILILDNFLELWNNNLVKCIASKETNTITQSPKRFLDVSNVSCKSSSCSEKYPSHKKKEILKILVLSLHLITFYDI